MRASPRIARRDGDAITILAGARDGVRAGMNRSVMRLVAAGDATQWMAIATFDKSGNAGCAHGDRDGQAP
ncbi:MAG: hypothetical protein V1750_08170 [Acidobacteriota bacterium]